MVCRTLVYVIVIAHVKGTMPTFNMLLLLHTHNIPRGLHRDVPHAELAGDNRTSSKTHTNKHMAPAW